MPLVLSDTTVLSNFAQVRRPDLLRRCFSALGTTATVMEELVSGERLGLVPEGDWQWLSVLNLQEQEKALASDLRRQLDPGEASCIAIAYLRGYGLLTDDRNARRTARGLGVAISGTLGALERLVEKEILDVLQADLLLQEMIRKGYRSPVQSLREAQH